MQVVVIIAAALRFRHPVIDFGCDRHATGTLADLTQAAVTQQDARATLRPRVAVATLVAIAAHRIRFPLHFLAGVLFAVRLATSDESAASAMLTRAQRPTGHFYLTWASDA
ncbi:hypothetical protein [Paraburkholderia xenovorans]|uniref:hypothetical protein n=1 Tax=Paraburkholderia xenovorans TaxID=36873 RepID=UPI003F5367BA